MKYLASTLVALSLSTTALAQVTAPVTPEPKKFSASVTPQERAKREERLQQDKVRPPVPRGAPGADAPPPPPPGGPRGDGAPPPPHEGVRPEGPPPGGPHGERPPHPEKPVDAPPVPPKNPNQP